MNWPIKFGLNFHLYLSFFFGGGGEEACEQNQNLMNWPIYVSTSMTLESVNSATLKLRRRMRFSAVLFSSLVYFLVVRLQVMT